MRLTIGEIRVVIVAVIYVVSTLFAKFFLGGYESETIFIVTALLVVYILLEKKGKNKR